MWLPLLFLIIGLSLGFLANIPIPAQYADYLSIAVLAALDTLFGGVRAQLEAKFDQRNFVFGFFLNVSIAALLVFLGTQWGMDLYLAAIAAFGVRLFHNAARIRKVLLDNYQQRKENKSTNNKK
ncbi:MULTISPECIES: small basic family protein [Gracilibacillus]|uniref:small basic family protein n=1 Tax=Gracilibacillus TaxID=74385 RepID=UPI0008269ACE|nr:MULTISPECIES: DUF1290 domain-containing protein [Gracilibacillus]